MHAAAASVVSVSAKFYRVIAQRNEILWNPFYDDPVSPTKNGGLHEIIPRNIAITRLTTEPRLTWPEFPSSGLHKRNVARFVSLELTETCCAIL
jgi:hypothetical protein